MGDINARSNTVAAELPLITVVEDILFTRLFKGAAWSWVSGPPLKAFSRPLLLTGTGQRGAARASESGSRRYCCAFITSCQYVVSLYLAFSTRLPQIWNGVTPSLYGTP